MRNFGSSGGTARHARGTLSPSTEVPHFHASSLRFLSECTCNDTAHFTQPYQLPLPIQFNSIQSKLTSSPSRPHNIHPPNQPLQHTQHLLDPHRLPRRPRIRRPNPLPQNLAARYSPGDIGYKQRHAHVHPYPILPRPGTARSQFVDYECVLGYE
jgi:hypothetical protein